MLLAVDLPDDADEISEADLRGAFLARLSEVYPTDDGFPLVLDQDLIRLAVVSQEGLTTVATEIEATAYSRAQAEHVNPIRDVLLPWRERKVQPTS